MDKEIKDAKFMVLKDDGATWFSNLPIESATITYNDPETEKHAEQTRSFATSVECILEAKVSKKSLRILGGIASNNELRMAHLPMWKRRANLKKFQKRINKAIRKRRRIPYYKYPWWVKYSLK